MTGGTGGVFRVATFNIENLDDDKPGYAALADRIAILRPQLLRLRADVLCFQEVNGQAPSPGGNKASGRVLRALDTLLAGTPYADYQRIATLSDSGLGVRDRHNLVIASRFPIVSHCQVRNDLVAPPDYRMVLAEPAAVSSTALEWDRPLLSADIRLDNGDILQIVNLHLRAPRAAFVPGQKISSHEWRTVSGWAEGFFIAAVKRAGQAFEARLFIDQLFDADADARILVCGDLNAEINEMPVRTIRGDEEGIGNGKLVPRILLPLEESVPLSQRYSVIHAGRPHMVDHMLASPSLMALYRGCEIHNEGLGDEFATPAVVQGAPESYHAPIVADFSLETAGG